MRLRGKQALNLQLVEVNDIFGTNVADPANNLKATASQSSTIRGTYHGFTNADLNATNAIDSSSDVITHTKTEQGN